MSYLCIEPTGQTSAQSAIQKHKSLPINLLKRDQPNLYEDNSFNFTQDMMLEKTQVDLYKQQDNQGT